jgi:predicted O-methyltransferase YrrM
MAKPWYDTLSPEEQEEVREILVHGKNPEKDPSFTRKFLERISTTAAVFTSKGEYIRIRGHMRDGQLTEIRKALRETKAKQTLEVGFAFGTSALAFAEYHQRMNHTGIHHTIIDPKQNSEDHWRGVGIENLKRCGFVKGKNYRLLEESSISALPALLKKHGTGWLDMALVDGLHLFDYTLIDVFYCLQMLRVGGILIVDDKPMKAVRAVANYLNEAYTFVVDKCPKCYVLVVKKIAEDTRDWNSDEKVNFDLK